MKKFLFLFLITFCFASINSAQEKVIDVEKPVMEKSTSEEPANVAGPVMTFEDGNTDTAVDYGVIEQHGEPLRTVKFTNTGTEPLVIKNARGSCGCTVPTWPKEPILPGETSEIEIRYATNRIGKINKKVTITTNEADGKNTHKISVLGKILKPNAEESAPKSEPALIGEGM